MIAYKLLRQRKNGTLSPLFINKSSVLPLGIWMDADFIPTRGFALRPGWHLTPTPSAPHLAMNGRVWVECEVDGNQVEPDLTQIPSGWYTWPRPKQQGGEWIIAGRIKINKFC
jgi:hypothetical protein